MGIKHYPKVFMRFLSGIVLAAFVLTSVVPPAYAQAMPWMPQPGIMVGLSAAFTPAHLRGMVINANDPFKFDFIIHKGDLALSDAQQQDEYKKLIKYFLAALAVPDKDQWVNLSPYEQNRIIADNFGMTEMGRDLLAQDYLLKQIASSLTHPDQDLGKQFWARVYEESHQKFGTTDVPASTINKVWIMPERAELYEKGQSVYVVSSHLKVMMEEDYVALKENALQDGAKPPEADAMTKMSSQIMREVIIPALEKEVNEGKNFAPLRQVLSGMLLATWYKKSLKESILGKVYADQGKVKGVDQKDPKTNQQIYDQYVASLKAGAFNMIKEDVDKYTQELIPRKYFSGGVDSWSKAMLVKVDKVVPDASTDTGTAAGTGTGMGMRTGRVGTGIGATLTALLVAVSIQFITAQSANAGPLRDFFRFHRPVPAEVSSKSRNVQQVNIEGVGIKVGDFLYRIPQINNLPDGTSPLASKIEVKYILIKPGRGLVLGCYDKDSDTSYPLEVPEKDGLVGLENDDYLPGSPEEAYKAGGKFLLQKDAEFLQVATGLIFKVAEEPTQIQEKDALNPAWKIKMTAPIGKLVGPNGEVSMQGGSTEFSVDNIADNPGNLKRLKGMGYVPLAQPAAKAMKVETPAMHNEQALKAALKAQGIIGATTGKIDEASKYWDWSVHNEDKSWPKAWQAFHKILLAQGSAQQQIADAEKDFISNDDAPVSLQAQEAIRSANENLKRLDKRVAEISNQMASCPISEKMTAVGAAVKWATAPKIGMLSWFSWNEALAMVKGENKTRAQQFGEALEVAKLRVKSRAMYALRVSLAKRYGPAVAEAVMERVSLRNERELNSTIDSFLAQIRLSLAGKMSKLSFTWDMSKLLPKVKMSEKHERFVQFEAVPQDDYTSPYLITPRDEFNHRAQIPVSERSEMKHAKALLEELVQLGKTPEEIRSPAVMDGLRGQFGSEVAGLVAFMALALEKAVNVAPIGKNGNPLFSVGGGDQGYFGALDTLRSHISNTHLKGAAPEPLLTALRNHLPGYSDLHLDQVQENEVLAEIIGSFLQLIRRSDGDDYWVLPAYAVAYAFPAVSVPELAMRTNEAKAALAAAIHEANTKSKRHLGAVQGPGTNTFLFEKGRLVVATLFDNKKGTARALTFFPKSGDAVVVSVLLRENHLDFNDPLALLQVLDQSGSWQLFKSAAPAMTTKSEGERAMRTIEDAKADYEAAGKEYRVGRYPLKVEYQEDRRVSFEYPTGVLSATRVDGDQVEVSFRTTSGDFLFKFNRPLFSFKKSPIDLFMALDTAKNARWLTSGEDLFLQAKKQAEIRLALGKSIIYDSTYSPNGMAEVYVFDGMGELSLDVMDGTGNCHVVFTPVKGEPFTAELDGKVVSDNFGPGLIPALFDALEKAHDWGERAMTVQLPSGASSDSRTVLAFVAAFDRLTVQNVRVNGERGWGIALSDDPALKEPTLRRELEQRFGPNIVAQAGQEFLFWPASSPNSKVGAEMIEMDLRDWLAELKKTIVARGIAEKMVLFFGLNVMSPEIDSVARLDNSSLEVRLTSKPDVSLVRKAMIMYADQLIRENERAPKSLTGEDVVNLFSIDMKANERLIVSVKLKEKAMGAPKEESAMPAKGGIDLNAANLDMMIKRDGNGVPLPISQQNLESIKIDGLVPVILDIRPAASLPMFSQAAADTGGGSA